MLENMISRNRAFVNRAACTAACVALWIVSSVPFVAAQSSWQAEWEKILRAAEAEGQFALYGCCYDYDRVLEVFRKRYPKIKPNIVVAVAGNSLASRILAERRAEKYLVDVVSPGANMLHEALYKAQLLEPIKAALMLPEVFDQTKGMRVNTATSTQTSATFLPLSQILYQTKSVIPYSNSSPPINSRLPSFTPIARTEIVFSS